MRRRRSDRGFSLVEAIVALAVAALTFSLLTGATWGLQMAMATDDTAGTEATDYLAARRALQGWASAVSSNVSRQRPGMLGNFTSVRMRLGPSALDQRPGYLAGIDITEVGNTYVVTARRLTGARALTASMEGAATSEILRSRQKTNLTYLVERGDRPGQRWVYELNSGAGLPHAVGIEIGGERVLIARVFTDKNAACIAAEGLAGLERRACQVR